MASERVELTQNDSQNKNIEQSIRRFYLWEFSTTYCNSDI